MAFDGIVTKALVSELQQLIGGRIDKIFQPSKNNIILGLYSNFSNYALNINIDSQNYRIHLTTHPKPNPKVAPNFCMVLRKHLIGLHIKNIITYNLERLVIIEFEGFDDIDDIITKKLVIELMGKHCNVILLDDQNIIIDSLRHINNENSLRVVIPHCKYVYPTSDKYNFLDFFEFDDFMRILPEDLSITNASSYISNTFNGISKSLIQETIEYLHLIDDKKSIEKLHDYLKQLISGTNSLELEFKNILYNNKNDYFPIPSKISTNFSLNFFIDDFYYNKELIGEFKAYRDSMLRMILDILKKYNKRLININEKLANCDNMQKYKLYGELITANLYQINNNINIKEITLNNYYDNNNPITITLDDRCNPATNAKLFFKKYNKLKNTLEIVSIQKQETIQELDYIESIIYELENSTSIDDVANILEEISENVIFKDKTDSYKNKKKERIKKSSLTKNKNVSFNPIKYTIEGYTLLVGRNNKENDYLTLKYAKKTDLWFHTKDIHGSHAILQILNDTIPSDDILTRCAEIVAYHSKARNSSNVPVDMCKVKYVKKPNGANPGMVIYTNNRTLYVNPKK